MERQSEPDLGHENCDGGSVGGGCWAPRTDPAMATAGCQMSSTSRGAGSVEGSEPHSVGLPLTRNRNPVHGSVREITDNMLLTLALSSSAYVLLQAPRPGAPSRRHGTLQHNLEAENAALRAELAALRESQQRAENAALRAEIDALRAGETPASAMQQQQRADDAKTARDVAAAIAALSAAGTLAFLGVDLMLIDADLIALAVGAVSSLITDEEKQNVVGSALKTVGGGVASAASEAAARAELAPKARQRLSLLLLFLRHVPSPPRPSSPSPPTLLQARAALQLVLETAAKGAAGEVGARAVGGVLPGMQGAASPPQAQVGAGAPGSDAPRQRRRDQARARSPLISLIPLARSSAPRPDGFVFLCPAGAGLAAEPGAGVGSGAGGGETGAGGRAERGVGRGEKGARGAQWRVARREASSGGAGRGVGRGARVAATREWGRGRGA